MPSEPGADRALEALSCSENARSLTQALQLSYILNQTGHRVNKPVVGIIVPGRTRFPDPDQAALKGPPRVALQLYYDRRSNARLVFSSTYLE